MSAVDALEGGAVCAVVFAEGWWIWKRGLHGAFEDINKLIKRVIEGPSRPEINADCRVLHQIAALETEIDGHIMSSSVAEHVAVCPLHQSIYTRKISPPKGPGAASPVPRLPDPSHSSAPARTLSETICPNAPAGAHNQHDWEELSATLGGDVFEHCENCGADRQRKVRIR